MYRAFEVLPEMVITPHDAFQEEVRGNIEMVDLNDMVGKVSANMILPYPPGVPVILPGERITKESMPVLNFLQMLCDIGEHYPGFETDIHGVIRDEETKRYRVVVLKPGTDQPGDKPSDTVKKDPEVKKEPMKVKTKAAGK